MTEIMQNLGFTEFVSDHIAVETEHGEIYAYVDRRKKIGDTVVCNLASINMGRVPKDKIKDVAPVVVRMLDNVIDNNFYPIPEAEYTNQKYRAIGLGVMGYHQYLAELGIAWESNAHLRETESYFRELRYWTLVGSCDLAEEKGAYPMFPNSEYNTGMYFSRRPYYQDERYDDHQRFVDLDMRIRHTGLRNGYQQSPAPTASISVAVGTTEGTDPAMRLIWNQEKTTGFIKQAVPNLNPQTYHYYTPTAYQINQLWSIKAQGVRQRYIDQGNSFNLYIGNQVTNPAQLRSNIIAAYDGGVKSIYYTRTEVETIEAEACESCQ